RGDARALQDVLIGLRQPAYATGSQKPDATACKRRYRGDLSLPVSPASGGKSWSMLKSVSVFKFVCVVVNPIQRTRKMTLIQMTSDSAATVLPARGAAASLSQRCTDLRVVISNTAILTPANAIIAILHRKKML